MFQRFVFDIYRHTHIFKQFGRIHKILSGLLDNTSEHYRSRLVYCLDCEILRHADGTDAQHYG